jgi:flavoprotein
MAFKRMEGFIGSIPQKFIDNHVPKCPMCGTTNPHWAIDQKMGFVSLNRYLFKCEQCSCILSATVADVTGIARTPLSTIGLAKIISGKKTSTIYMKIEDVGTMQTTKIHEGKELSLEEINTMADEVG